MDFIRNHWFDFGLGVALLTIGIVFFNIEKLSAIKLILWLNFIALLLHQFEEYRFPGYFPFFFNKFMYKSKMPDRYPLNTFTAFIINVFFGWIGYLLGVKYGEDAPAIGMIVILITFLNFIAHTFIANIRAKTLYNPGMITSILFGLPLTFFYFRKISGENIPAGEYITGIVFALIITFVGIILPIRLLADKNTTYIFEKRKYFKA
jgi:hypothetical protein